MNQLPALQQTVLDLVEEYDRKRVGVEEEVRAFEAAFDRLGMAMTVSGCFVEPVCSRSHLYPDSLRKNLLKSGWKAIFQRLNIAAVASAKDKQLFEQTLADAGTNVPTCLLRITTPRMAA